MSGEDLLSWSSHAAFFGECFLTCPVWGHEGTGQGLVSVPGELSLGAGGTGTESLGSYLKPEGTFQIICFDGLQTIFSLAEPSVESEVSCRFIKGKPQTKLLG